jgi:hypothetical protein
MAEEGTLGLPRASADRDDDDEPSKEELQRRMEEARETITQTVTEIKETVTNQYYSMTETVSDALDWRHHFRKNPVAFSVGALSVGFLVGYGLLGTLKGNRSSREGYPSSEETDVYARTGATPPRYEGELDSPERHSAFHGRSYAAQPIIDTASEGSDYEGSSSYEAKADDYGRSQGGSFTDSAPSEQQEETPQKPSLYDRFKETSAYDRLQTEVSSLGDRFIEELSSTAHNVVLPALFNKIKELFGVDLSGKQGKQTQSSSGGILGSGQESQTGAQTDTAARAASASASTGASASLGSASRGSSTSAYATSENRGYGDQSGTGATDKGSDAGSVLDLDR